MRTGVGCFQFDAAKCRARAPARRHPPDAHHPGWVSPASMPTTYPLSQAPRSTASTQTLSHGVSDDSLLPSHRCKRPPQAAGPARESPTNIHGAGNAHELFEQVARDDELVEFLTLPAYQQLRAAKVETRNSASTGGHA